MGACTGSSENKIIKMPELDFTPDPRGIGRVLFDSMMQNRNKIAQIDCLTGEEDTYASFLQRCVRTALTMRAKGLTSEDVVCAFTLNHLNSSVPYIAGLFLGAKVSALDPVWGAEEANRLFSKVTPKMIFTTPDAVDMVEEAVKGVSVKTEVVVYGKTDKHTSFGDFLKPKEGEDDFQPLSVTNQFDTALIFLSSGSTGFPKCICINHYHFLGQLENLRRYGLCFDIILFPSTLSWIGGVTIMSVAILLGSIKIVVPHFEAELMWKGIMDYKPTFICSLAHQHTMLMQHRPENANTSSLKHIGAGGSPASEDVILNMKKHFPEGRVFTNYGSTETAVIITIFKPAIPGELDLFDKNPTSSGTPIPGLWYKVVDPETEEILGPYQRGELRLKGKFIMNGYYNQDSSEAWDSDGWFKTGDIVYYDENKLFFVVDRIKEVIKCRDWAIHPAVVEGIILKHPLVSNVVVLGMPHEKDIEQPMALVELIENKNVNSEEIERLVRENYPGEIYLLGGVKFVKKIPLSPTGKPKRRELRDMILQGKL